MDPLIKERPSSKSDYRMALFRLQLDAEIWGDALASALGLSPLPIFDTVANRFTKEVETLKSFRKRKGQSGITTHGRRMVKSAAAVLEERYGKARCIFSTVTVPDLPLKQMAIIHENWHKLVEYYRLGVRRKLQDKHLSGDIVSVSEIQTKRYDKTGLPILHLHAVFVGVYGSGQYAITTEEHDDIWVRAVNSVTSVDRNDFTHACNLQRVKKSASAYLGKYLSKGVHDVAFLIAKGFGDWLPKHWWNCSRALSRMVKSETRVLNGFADWLNYVADFPGNGIWVWHRDFYLDMDDGERVSMARYGRLNWFEAAKIELTLDPW